MSDNDAARYADSIAADIRANVDAGSPFGIVSDDNPVTDRENGDDIDAYDYLQDVLDIQYLVSAEGEYRHARILIAFGGPNAWIDTRSGELEVSWWSPVERRKLPSAFIDALDEALEELWDGSR